MVHETTNTAIYSIVCSHLCQRIIIEVIASYDFKSVIKRTLASAGRGYKALCFDFFDLFDK